MAGNKKLPSVERLREVFDYEPGTGKLTRKVKRGNNGPIGPVGSDGGQGYLYVSLDHGRYLFHRLVWAHHYGEWPTKVIDHIDGNGHNNSIANLRDVSSRENSANMLRNKEVRADAAKWRAHVAASSADSLAVGGGEAVAWLVRWSDIPMESPEVTRSASRIAEVSALTNPPHIVPLYEAPPALPVDLPYPLDADPAGIRARVADCITGTLMVGAQGHTPPPAGHWAEPFWRAALADAALQVKMREALWAAARSLRTIADSTKETEFLETASEIRAYANSRANCAEQAVIDSQAVGNG